MVAGHPTTTPGINGVHETFSNIGVYEKCHIPRFGTTRNEECIGEHVTLLVGEFVLILNRVNHDHIQQVENGLVKGFLDSGTSVFLENIFPYVFQGIYLLRAQFVFLEDLEVRFTRHVTD